jgi:hypothetical protein
VFVRVGGLRGLETLTEGNQGNISLESRCLESRKYHHPT